MRSGNIQQRGYGRYAAVDGTNKPRADIFELELGCRQLFRSHLVLQAVEANAVRYLLGATIWQLSRLLRGRKEETQLSRRLGLREH